MQWAFGIHSFRAKSTLQRGPEIVRDEARLFNSMVALKVNFRGILRILPRLRDPLKMTPCLFRRGERLVKTRLSTIGRVTMNNPTLGRFIDSRDRCANLIGGTLRG